MNCEWGLGARDLRLLTGNVGWPMGTGENRGSQLGSHSQHRSTDFAEQLQALLGRSVKTKPCRHWKSKGEVCVSSHWPHGHRKSRYPGLAGGPCTCCFKHPSKLTLPLLHNHSITNHSSTWHHLPSLPDFANNVFPEPFFYLHFCLHRLEDSLQIALPPPSFSPSTPWILSLKLI